MKYFIFNLLSITILLIHFRVDGQPNANTWTWQKGYNTINQNGVYGTKGLFAADNTPGSRYGGITWEINQHLYLYGGTGFDDTSNSAGDLADLWEYDANLNSWRWLSGYKIKNVTSQFSVTDGPGSIGGSNGWVYNNKLYLFFYDKIVYYDIATNLWSEVTNSIVNSSYPNYGTLGVPATSNWPGFRGNPTTWTYNNKFYLFGGQGFPEYSPGVPIGFKNDLWQFDPTTNTWTWLAGSKNINQISNSSQIGGLQGATANVADNFVYIIGGRSVDQNGFIVTTDDTLKIDLSNFQMSIFKQLGGSARAFHNSWYYNNNYYFFGGINSTGYLSGFGILDLNYYISSSISIRVNAPSVYGLQNTPYPYYTKYPGSRAFAMSWYHDKKMYYFGGQDFNGNVNNDLWVFVPSCNDIDFFTLSNGNWSDASNWSCGRVPTVDDAVNIKGHSINLLGNNYAQKITYLNGGNLIFNNGATLQLKELILPPE